LTRTTPTAAILVAGLFSLLSTPALASVIYEFSGTAPGKYDPQLGETFTFTTDDFITASLTVPGSNLDSCSVTSTTVQYSCAEVDFAPGTSYDTMTFLASTAGGAEIWGTEYLFAAGAFSASGTYSMVPFGDFGPISGQLTVSESTKVPEPTSFALLSLGLGVLGGARLRRQRLG